MADFILFGTEACHLCEDAVSLLASAGIRFKFADIMEQQEWLDKYALSIPVLRHEASGRELYWPFDEGKLHTFLEKFTGSSPPKSIPV